MSLVLETLKRSIEHTLKVAGSKDIPAEVVLDFTPLTQPLPKNSAPRLSATIIFNRSVVNPPKTMQELAGWLKNNTAIGDNLNIPDDPVDRDPTIYIRGKEPLVPTFPPTEVYLYSDSNSVGSKKRPRVLNVNWGYAHIKQPQKTPV